MGKVKLLALLQLIGQLQLVNGRTDFAEPLVVARPNSQGIYEFNLLIKHRISMTIQNPHQELNIIDYSPSLAKFVMRNNDPTINTTTTVTNTSLLNSVIQLNGLHYLIFSINGDSPARPIVVPFNSTVIFRVTNEADAAITLHMHGLNNQWYRDGVPGLQQCAIAPRSVYSYRFFADVPGTHWYHGHLGTDRSEGLLGSLVILPKDVAQTGVGGQTPAGREYLALLQHWPQIPINLQNFIRLTELGKWSYGLENTRTWAEHRGYDGAVIGGSIPVTGFMINDKGWYDQNDIKTRPQNLPLEVFKIRKGETIRLRLVNGGISQALMVSIENHPFTIVASDGIELKPLTSGQKANMLIIYPGERYDLLISGSATTKKTHYIIFETLDYTDNIYNRITPNYALAKLVYDDISADANNAPDLTHRSCTSATPCRIVNCPFRDWPTPWVYFCVNMGDMRNQEPITDQELLKDDGRIAKFQEAVMDLQKGNSVNGFNYLAPRAPPYFYPNDETAVATPCDRSKCQQSTDPVVDENCKCFHHLNITLGNVVQLTIVSSGPFGSSVAHPIHIHGTHFYVMKVGYPNYDSSTKRIVSYSSDIVCESQATCNQPRWRNSSWVNGRVPGMNTRDPPSKDSLIVPAGGYAVIRFRANNPGWFFAHCHFVFHNMGGMSFALRVGNRDQMPVPPANFPHSCGTFEDPGSRTAQAQQEVQLPVPRSLTEPETIICTANRTSSDNNGNNGERCFNVCMKI